MNEHFSFRVKVFYQEQIFSLGKTPKTIETLLDLIQKSIPRSLSRNYIILKYYDCDNDLIILTTTESLNEAYSMYPDCLRVYVDYKPANDAIDNLELTEDLLCIKDAWKALRAVFSVFIDGQCRGLGVLVNLRLGMTTSKVLASQEDASKAMMYFEDTSVPITASPEVFFITSDKISFFSFKSTYLLSEVQELRISPVGMSFNTKGLTLGKSRDSDILASIKSVNVKETIGYRLIYETVEECGRAGSPLFDNKWELLGLQITDRSCINEVYSCTEILRALKQLEYIPKVVSLIQSIEPLSYTLASYSALLLTPSIAPDRVYGINSAKDCILSYNIKTSQSSTFILKEKSSEGASLCTLPNGIFITGGRNSLRKGWISFFIGDPNWFEIEMPQAHYTHASVYFDGKVYIIGGKNSTRAINNCETFNYLTNKWEIIPPLRHNRSYPAVSVFKNSLYVFGGNSGEEDLDSIEYLYNGRWKLFDIKMPCRLFGVAAFYVDDDTVMVLGGKSLNTKFNLKIFSMRFEEEKFKVHNSEQKLGMSNAINPLYANEAIYFYNNEGDLAKYCRYSTAVYKLKKDIVCKFDF